MVLRNLRNITQDFENQDAFFEVHLQTMMAKKLESELATIADTLIEYRENHGFINYPYKFVDVEHQDYTQYEFTTVLHMKLGLLNPPYVQNLINRHWLRRTPLMEIERYYLPIKCGTSIIYSIHNARDLYLSFRLEPMKPNLPRHEQNKRAKSCPKSYQCPEHFDFSLAFTKRIKLLILEVAFDLPHHDIRRQELYFNEHIPITGTAAHTRHQLLKYLKEEDPARWQYATENFLKATLNHIFALISNVMYYLLRHYGETPLQLFEAYYNTRYVTLVTTCATQIINFYKDVKRKAESSAPPPPLEDGPRSSGNARHENEGEEYEPTPEDWYTNPHLWNLLGRMLRNEQNADNSGN